MQPDILKKIETDFAKPQNVVILLEAFVAGGGVISADRLCRAVLFLAKGDEVQLVHCIDLARSDEMALLLQAECDGGATQKYDFNKTFMELGLL